MPRRHSALLVAIVLLFAVRPLLGDNTMALIAFSIVLMAVLILGLYTIQVDELVGEHRKLLAERKRRSIYRLEPGLGGDGRTPVPILFIKP